MKTLQHLIAVFAVMLLAACTSSPERNQQLCVAGGAITGLLAAGGGPALAAGAIAGGGIGGVLCSPPAPPEPEPVAMAADADTDGDGVADNSDRCPDTPPGVNVDASGCPLDSDNDGVADYEDRCANTPAGATVDEWGCPVAGEVIFSTDEVNFAFDSARLSSRARSALNSALEVIRDNPSVQLDLVGHTDSLGSETYNLGLSERRARAAREYLVSRGVSAERLRAIGRGEAEPIASNDTDSGRARNRRVELVVR